MREYSAAIRVAVWRECGATRRGSSRIGEEAGVFLHSARRKDVMCTKNERLKLGLEIDNVSVCVFTQNGRK